MATGPPVQLAFSSHAFQYTPLVRVRWQKRRRRRVCVHAPFPPGCCRTLPLLISVLFLLLLFAHCTQAFVLAPPGVDRRIVGGRKRLEDCRRRPPSFVGTREGICALGSALADRQQASSNSNGNSISFSNSNSNSNFSASTPGRPSVPLVPTRLVSTSFQPPLQQDIAPGSPGVAEARFVAECEMPTDRGNFRMRSYRCDGDYAALEPVALTHGPLGGAENVLARVHDQCLTSEVFGSKRCDCKEQLGMALDMIREEGGVVIYLQQEGRGIGLANKVAAYALQDEGLDTVDANRHLGFGDDERTYDIVPSILRDLGVESIQLMTNNPLKLECLLKLGVRVSKVVPIVVAPNVFNERYLITKAERMAHTLSPALALQRSLVVPPAPATAGMRGGDSGERQEKAEISREILLSRKRKGVRTWKGVRQPEEGEAIGRKEVGPGRTDAGVSSGGREDAGLGEVEHALRSLREGRVVVLLDKAPGAASGATKRAPDGENGGTDAHGIGADLLVLAHMASDETLSLFLRTISGVTYCLLPPARLTALWKGSGAAATAAGLDLKDSVLALWEESRGNEDGSRGSSAARKRAATLRALGGGDGVGEREGLGGVRELSLSDFSSPGHVFVVSPGAAIGTAEDKAMRGLARPSPVSVRREWALEMARWMEEKAGSGEWKREGGTAGVSVGVAELVDRETGDGMTVEEVAALVEEHGLAVTSVEKVARFVHERQQQITTEGTVRVEEEEEGRI